MKGSPLAVHAAEGELRKAPLPSLQALSLQARRPVPSTSLFSSMLPPFSTSASRGRPLFSARFLSLVGLFLSLLAMAAAPAARAQTDACPDRTGLIALLCIQENYSPTATLGYSTARDVLYRDIDSDGSGTLEGIYSGYTITLTSGEDPSQDAFSKGINAEHVYPQSKGAGIEPERSDMHNLYPAREEVNSARSNIPYGESPDSQTDAWYRLDQVQSLAPTSNIDAFSERLGSTVWEPRESREGDVARAALYFFAVWREVADVPFFEGMREDLLNWHWADPATQAERDRSAAIAAEQGNENPFALDESLAGRTFGTRSGPALVFDPVRLEAGEGGGSLALTVRYKSPDGSSVTADVAFRADLSTASAGDLGSYSTQTVSFPSSAPDGATRTVTVALTDDAEVEETEEAIFQIENVESAGQARPGIQSASLLELKDNDSPLALNEILADPPSGPEGDANQDGARSATEDEFVEIYNTSASKSVDLSGYELKDAAGAKHVFPGGTSLGPETSVVVFGGGAPAASIPGLVQTASSGSLGLNNGGDDVTLTDGSGIDVLSYSYDGSVTGESITRSPDFTGSFVAHSSATGSGGALFSPGRTLEGSPLPVELVAFQADVSGERATLRWQTASETGNARFEVQRKEGEGRRSLAEAQGPWKTIGQVEGAGTTSEPQRYVYQAGRLAYGTHWFRLRQVDTDGTAHLSEAIKALVAPSSGLALEVYPTPVRSRATVTVATGRAQDVSVLAYDLLGRVVARLYEGPVAPGQPARLTLEGFRLGAGTYFVRAEGLSGSETRRATVVR